MMDYWEKERNMLRYMWIGTFGDRSYLVRTTVPIGTFATGYRDRWQRYSWRKPWS